MEEKKDKTKNDEAGVRRLKTFLVGFLAIFAIALIPKNKAPLVDTQDPVSEIKANENFKVFFDITVQNYNELYDIYTNLIDRASKLLTFLTIISGGLLFLIKWVFDNYNTLGPNYGWITLISVVLMIFLVIELGLILNAMFVQSLRKIRIKPNDNNYFLSNTIDQIYYHTAQRYSEANAENYAVIEKKSKWLGRAQWGLFILIIFIILGIIAIFYIK